MLRTSKTFILAIVLALTGLTGVAHAATEFALAPAGAIELASEGRVKFRTGEAVVECQITISGRLRNGPIRVSEGRMGEITAVRVGTCTGAGRLERALVEARSPWEVVSIGLLQPEGESITGILFVLKRARFRFATLGAGRNCLYESDMGFLVTLRRTGIETFQTQQARVLETFIFVRTNEPACPEEGVWEGQFRLTTQTITFR